MTSEPITPTLMVKIPDATLANGGTEVIDRSASVLTDDPPTRESELEAALTAAAAALHDAYGQLALLANDRSLTQALRPRCRRAADQARSAAEAAYQAVRKIEVQKGG